MSVLDAVFLVNLFLLTNSSSAAFNVWSSYYQGVDIIISVSFSLGLFIIIAVLHFWWKLKRKLRNHFEGDMQIPSVAENATMQEFAKNDNSTAARPGSPPSIVYGSRRGVRQFELVFDASPHNTPVSTPVLKEMDREPLIFEQ